MKYLKFALAAFLFTGSGIVTMVNAQAVEKVTDLAALKTDIKAAVADYTALVKKGNVSDEAMNNAYVRVHDLINDYMIDAKANVVSKSETGPEMKKYETTVNHFNQMIMANRATDKSKVAASMNAFVAAM